MKKKKILNIRNGLIAGALVVTTALAGLGIHLGSKDNQPVDPTPSENPNTSQTIIDENHTNTTELPGGIVIDPNITEPAVTDPIIIEPIETDKQNTGSETGKPSITGNPTGGNNNQGTATDPGTTTTDPTDPTITETVITDPIHVHTLGDWISINDFIEGSYCPEDGALVRVRLHNYKISDIESITNNNGTHNTYATLTCSNCDHTRTITRKNAECNYGELTWDTVYEYETCEDCGYKHVVGKHNFDKGIINGNQITYTCENENCGYSYTKPYTPSHNNGGNGNHGGDSSTDTQEHTHNWSKWTPISDEEHRRVCIAQGCTIKTQTYKHTFNEWSEWSIWIVTTDAEGNKIEYRTRTQSCDECGYVRTEKQTRPYNPEHTHNWSAWTVTKEPTCTEAGEKTRTCTVEGCTIKIQREKIPAKGHTYGEWIVSEDWHVVTKEDGTQIEERTLEQVCSVCGHINTKTETRPYTPEHTHNWSAWTVTKEPTCTETGIEERTCTVEGCTVITETRTISALGHDMGAYTTTKAPTCTEKGIETSSCSRCDHIENREINALGHTYGEWTVSEDWHVVTKEDGTQIEERTLEQVCSVCGHINTKTETRPYTPEHTHNWSAWTVTKEPTCTETGIEERTCTVEGCTVITETRTISALGHDMGAYTTTKLATCTEKGEETSSCSRCDHTDTRETAALGHHASSTPDSLGNIKCTECGEILENVGPILPPIPEHTHNWSEWTITTAATCTTDGERTRTCSADGCLIGTETETISALGHNMGSYTTTTSATCTEKGEETSTCSRCGHTDTRETAALGHHASSTPDSLGNIKCTECGEILENVGPILPPIPDLTEETNQEDQQLNTIIETQDQAKAEASANADQQLEDLLNSGASDVEMDTALEEIIAEQEQAISDANTAADQQLEEAITTTENARVDEIIAEQDSAIEAARQNAEAELEEIISSDADAETKDAAIDKVIEETDRAIEEATAKAEAELDALAGVSVTNSMKLKLTK